MNQFQSMLKLSKHPIEHHYNINEALLSLCRIQLHQYSRQGRLVDVTVLKKRSRYAVRKYFLLHASMGLS